MKKKLNIGGITNELAGASLFFAKSPPSEPKTSDRTLPESPATEQTKVQVRKETTKRKTENTFPTVKPKPVDKDVMTESLQASNNASMHASNQPLTHETIIETIRKAVKDVGKDSATYRFTPEEKKALLELSFSYKMQGYKTSENELIRIAINFMLEDQKQDGRNSVLQRVLDALRK
jgi:hypothetical protein